MNKSSATRILNKSLNMKGDYSVGFKRLHNTPSKIRLSLSKAYLLDGVSVNDINEKAKVLLESFTEAEFKNWLIIA